MAVRHIPVVTVSVTLVGVEVAVVECEPVVGVWPVRQLVYSSKTSVLCTFFKTCRFSCSY